MKLLAALAITAASAAVLGLVPTGSQPARLQARPHVGLAGPRHVRVPLYGVTVDDVTNLGAVIASSKHLSHRPTTRIYFDIKHGPRYYLPAATKLHRVSYVMGELLDSSDEKKISVRAFGARVESYLRTLGACVDIWEIGNEVNGDWTGRYDTVAAKLAEAYHDVTVHGYATALTLYDNIGCQDGRRELGPLAFSRRYVKPVVRDGLDYVLLSYYEDDCRHIRPSHADWASLFGKLHALYPHARLGFGEIGMNNPATPETRATARSLITYYYSLAIKLPYYIGGYFWWYYDEDALPYRTKPLWRTLNAGLRKEATAIGPG